MRHETNHQIIWWSMLQLHCILKLWITHAHTLTPIQSWTCHIFFSCVTSSQTVRDWGFRLWRRALWWKKWAPLTCPPPLPYVSSLLHLHGRQDERMLSVPRSTGPTITVKTAGDALRWVEKKKLRIYKYICLVYMHIWVSHTHNPRSLCRKILEGWSIRATGRSCLKILDLLASSSLYVRSFSPLSNI